MADVANPLFGPTGASHIFGPQKGATPDIIHFLDTELKSLADRTGNQTEAHLPRSGAAGGLGFAVLAYLQGTLISGFDFIAQAVGINDRLKKAHLCITAEGRIDAQTADGKAVFGIAQLCRQHHVPCVALAGAVDADALTALGLVAAFSICEGPMSLEESSRDVRRLLEQTAQNCAALWATQTAHDPRRSRDSDQSTATEKH